jgi:hypothetical protein
LHHRFEGWLGDELLETFPCFLVSSAMAAALEEAGLEHAVIESAKSGGY